MSFLELRQCETARMDLQSKMWHIRSQKKKRKKKKPAARSCSSSFSSASRSARRSAHSSASSSTSDSVNKFAMRCASIRLVNSVRRSAK